MGSAFANAKAQVLLSSEQLVITEISVPILISNDVLIIFV